MLDLKNIKCVVFDADNTLYSTKKVAIEADMTAMAILGSTSGVAPEQLHTEFMEVVKKIKDSSDPKVRHRKYSYGTLCAKYGVDLIEEMYAAFTKKVIERIEIIPKVPELLAKLSDRKLCVVTEDNREMATKKLTKLDLLSKFAAVITSDEAGIMKPSKNYYSAILSEFKPQEILAVGDNYDKDLVLPAELGMQTFLIDAPEKISELSNLV